VCSNSVRISPPANTSVSSLHNVRDLEVSIAWSASSQHFRVYRNVFVTIFVRRARSSNHGLLVCIRVQSDAGVAIIRGDARSPLQRLRHSSRFASLAFDPSKTLGSTIITQCITCTFPSCRLPCGALELFPAPASQPNVSEMRMENLGGGDLTAPP
jgi:hypothetical protein